MVVLKGIRLDTVAMNSCVREQFYVEIIDNSWQTSTGQIKVMHNILKDDHQQISNIHIVIALKSIVLSFK